MATKSFVRRKISLIKLNFKNISRLILQLLIALFITTSAFVLCPVSILILIPLKCTVYLIAKIFRPDLKHFMPSPGSILGSEDICRRPKLNLCCIFTFDGHIPLEETRAAFEERVIQKLKPNGELMYRELSMFWTTFLNYTFWKSEDNFDLKNHVRLYDYGNGKGNGNGSGAGAGADADAADPNEEDGLRIPDLEEGGFCEENDLRRILGHLLEKPWKEGTSPWEMLLIQNFKSNQSPPNNKQPAAAAAPSSASPCTVAIFRMHHGLGDGYSTLKLLLRDFMLVPPNIKINYPKMKPWKQILFSLVLPLKLPWDMAGGLLNAVDGENSWHGWGENHRLSRKILTSLSKPIDIQIFKDVKNKYGVGYNSVLCAVVAAGCQRVMEEAGQVVPKKMSCFIPFPLPNHPDGLVNHVSFHLFKWAMDPRLTRKERLLAISKKMSPSKYYTAPLGYTLLIKVLNITPNIVFKLRNFAPFTVGLTSFPGPAGAPQCTGLDEDVRLVDTFGGVGPGFGTVGTTMCLISSNGKQRFTINTDKNNFPSEAIFNKFGDYIEEELMALLDLGTGTGTGTRLSQEKEDSNLLNFVKSLP